MNAEGVDKEGVDEELSMQSDVGLSPVVYVSACPPTAYKRVAGRPKLCTIPTGALLWVLCSGTFAVMASALNGADANPPPPSPNRCGQECILKICSTIAAIAAMAAAIAAAIGAVMNFLAECLKLLAGNRQPARDLERGRAQAGGQGLPREADTNNTGPPELGDTNNMESVDTNNMESVDSNNMESVDSNNVESVDTNNMDLVDTNNMDLVDTNNMDLVDTNSMDLVDTNSSFESEFKPERRLEIVVAPGNCNGVDQPGCPASRSRFGRFLDWLASV